jgi:hypothetical protein
MWQWLWRRPPLSPEIYQAGLIFRLQRYGIPTPRLLAVGQRQSFPGRTASFLLTETPANSVSLTGWLAAAQGKQRWSVIRAVAAVLHRLHSAGCALAHRSGEDLEALFQVQGRANADPVVRLGSVAPLRIRRHSGSVQGIRDVRILGNWLPTGLCRRTDALRFLLAYLGLKRLTPTAKRLTRQLLRDTTVARGVAQ